MYGIQGRAYRVGIDKYLLVLLIGGIPIAVPTFLSVTMAIGSHRLSQQEAITKRMTAIEEMAGMDVLCSDKTIMTISKDRVKPSPIPNCWKLSEIFATGIVIGSYLAIMTVVFFWLAFKTDFFAVNASIAIMFL
ncbi:hypothetical protein NC653_008621 [Populus alba x Populus x berolinensis]|uniref:Uncharacterized protein n=1 Tax=Populus alba x Populus x berolinensis TaxID=444605 RepID=A0AAD6W8N0_9ROSI|nr:hypothetical protein NC653_008621 [Populus alba x Populus x berolinensis]